MCVRPHRKEIVTGVVMCPLGGKIMFFTKICCNDRAPSRRSLAVEVVEHSHSPPSVKPLWFVEAVPSGHRICGARFL